MRLGSVFTLSPVHVLESISKPSFVDRVPNVINPLEEKIHKLRRKLVLGEFTDELKKFER